jgi:NTP pyrophosphatase (non-canonical NTP hydrolase)
MNISDLQQEVGEWGRANFGSDKADLGLILSEEAGEICRAILKRRHGHRASYEEWTTEIRKEVPDVLLVLFRVAYEEGWDLGEALEDRWAQIKLRDWNKDKIGHGLPK